MKTGTLYGISVGPGDPELLTVKAINKLNSISIIATPRTKSGKTMALDIASKAIDMKDKDILYLDFEMSKDAKVLEASHKEQAQKLEQYLAAGKDVAMLNIGDASLYSTFSYINDIIVADGYESIVIPGVTSFCAVAAELGQSLTTMNEPLTIIPGGSDDLKKLLASSGSKVIMKPASAINQIKKTLNDMNLLKNTKAVCNCGLNTQKVYENVEKIPDNGDYFITLLVKNDF